MPASAEIYLPHSGLGRRLTDEGIRIASLVIWAACTPAPFEQDMMMLGIRSISLASGVGLSLALVGNYAWADSIFQSAPVAPDTIRMDPYAQAGWGFYATTLGTRQVNEVGYWVSPNDVNNQLAEAHTVAIYNYNGVDYTQIASAVVPQGRVADASGYAWVSIPTLTLSDTRQGADYYLVMASQGTDTWAPLTGSAHTHVVDPTFGTPTGLGWFSTLAAPGVGGHEAFPDHLQNGGYFGPNLGFVPVPLPSAAWGGMVLIGGLGVLRIRRHIAAR